MERLISHFSNRGDVSFVYVIHDINSGFITYRRNDPTAELDNIQHGNEDYIYIYNDQVKAWRKELKIEDDDELLVAFAWCHDEELRTARVFPEFWGCDTTFRFTQE